MGEGSDSSDLQTGTCSAVASHASDWSAGAKVSVLRGMNGPYLPSRCAVWAFVELVSLED